MRTTAQPSRAYSQSFGKNLYKPCSIYYFPLIQLPINICILSLQILVELPVRLSHYSLFLIWKFRASAIVFIVENSYMNRHP